MEKTSLPHKTIRVLQCTVHCPILVNLFTIEICTVTKEERVHHVSVYQLLLTSGGALVLLDKQGWGRGANCNILRTLHSIRCPYNSLHNNSLHHNSLHNNSPHHNSPHHNSPHHNSPHHNSPNNNSPHNNSLL
jgi:hypothetical protein